MENQQTMQQAKQREKISRFSKVIYTLMQVAFILLIIVGILQAIVWLWTTAGMHTDLVNIGGREVYVPYLFKIGDFKVHLPLYWQANFDFSFGMDYLDSVPFLQVGIDDLLLSLFSLVGLFFGKVLFKLLRENGFPFRQDVARAMKRLAIALLCMGTISGPIPLLGAALVWVLCLIFEYGAALQAESDTTL